MFNMSSILNQKDSRWLQLEVCREYQRQKCTRCDAECKFAHPPANVEVQNGRVTACYDSIKVGKKENFSNFLMLCCQEYYLNSGSDDYVIWFTLSDKSFESITK